MIPLIIILAVFIIIALLRIGVAVEYGEEGFKAAALIGPFSIRVFPRKTKARGKKKEKAIRKTRKEKKSDKEKKGKSPGDLNVFQDILPAAVTALSRLKRKLYMKRLIIIFTYAGADPSKVALTFGRSHAVSGIVLPLIENNFKVRRREISVSADFNCEKSKIYFNAAVSLAVWEVFYIAFAVIPMILKMLRTIKTDKQKGRKR